MKNKQKSYCIKTFGCQANIADSNLISSVLDSCGMVESREIKDADILVINTCSVRQKSEDKVYGIARKLKSGKKPFVILAGCMVGSTKGDRKRYNFSILKKKTPWVDMYLDSDSIHSLPELLEKSGFSFPKNINYDLVEDNYYKKVYEDYAIVNISYGCDNFCTYCVVPYSRGEERSRGKAEIMQEIEGFISKGHKKVLLCGQNVNSWGLDKDQKSKVRIGSSKSLPFAKLLREVHEIEEVKEISFLSSNPFDFTKDLVDAVSLPKISNYIHVAVQSGNNDILARMNRRHKVEEFIELIKDLKKEKPEMELGTDIIVGFPGETEDQFMDTVKLFQTIKFRVAFISMYSERIGTIAQKMYEDDIPLSEKKRRHAILTKVWRESLNEK